MLRDLYEKYASTRRRGYPLERTDTRELPVDYQGLVITSDIDKTYLQTPLGSLRGLIRTALESADAKRSFQGMVPLYRGLSYGSSELDQNYPLYFISASPPTMRKVLTQKMELDLIHPDGITLKKWFRLLRHGRWNELKKHVVYKLNALLVNRSVRPITAQIQEILIGDDSETDADVYLLYAQILRRQISSDDLLQKLGELGATDREQEQILLLTQRQDHSQVARIYIHCTTYQQPERLPNADPHLLMGALDSLQIAMDAHQHGWMSLDSVQQVGWEFRVDQRHDSLHNLIERKLLTTEQLQTYRTLW